MYKVNMTFLAEEDNYNDGLVLDGYVNYWDMSEEFKTLDEVKEFVKDNTYSGYDYLEYEPDFKEYRTSYPANAENIGEASKQELGDWKQGKCKIWDVSVNVRVEKYTPKIIGNIQFK